MDHMGPTRDLTQGWPIARQAPYLLCYGSGPQKAKVLLLKIEFKEVKSGYFWRGMQCQSFFLVEVTWQLLAM